MRHLQQFVGCLEKSLNVLIRGKRRTGTDVALSGIEGSVLSGREDSRHRSTKKPVHSECLSRFSVGDRVWQWSLIIMAIELLTACHQSPSENLADVSHETFMRQAINVNWPAKVVSSAEAHWQVVDDTAYRGSSAIRSGAIKRNQRSCFAIRLQESGRFRFYWKVSSEPDSDYLRFYINGREESRISGTSHWQPVVFRSRTAKDTLKWCYTKDYAISKGQDAGWVDALNQLDELPE